MAPLVAGSESVWVMGEERGWNQLVCFGGFRDRERHRDCAYYMEAPTATPPVLGVTPITVCTGSKKVLATRES